jgi:hypothetical protein
MKTSGNRHFYSIAPEFGIYDRELDQTYHYTNYQLRLQAAAMELGHDFTIVAPTNCSIVTAGVVKVLPTEPDEDYVASITPLIESLAYGNSDSPPVILVYEGSLSIVEAFLPLARRFEDISFFINLFLYEPVFKLSSTDVTSRKISQPYEQFKEAGNLHVFAETDSKRLAARQLGMPSVNKWNPFSAICDVHSNEPKPGPSNHGYRILIPLSSWQLSEGLVREMMSIKEKTESDCSQRLEFHLTGHLADPEIEPILSLMSDDGFVITPASREEQEYANLFASHDVVWLPNPYYTLQSSGKALDALVQATPIIAPAGTFGWVEQNRWVSGATGYSSAGEASCLFSNLQCVLPAIQADLEEQNERIRECYSPSNTISSLLVPAVEFDAEKSK